MPSFFVYVLENPEGRLYIGQTNNLEQRLRQHNTPVGKSHLGKFTHKHGPWRLKGSETFSTRSSAVRREKQMKAWKSPTRIKARFCSSVVEFRPRRD